MATITVVLPDKALKALEKRAKSEGKALEELISEVVFEQLNITDPKAKMELHLKLCDKYIGEAKDFLAKRDYVQASEKAWGAASQMVKAVAAKRGIELRSYRELWELVTNLSKEQPDWNLLSMFHVANSLHINFYENWLTIEAVINGIDVVKEFIEKLGKLI